MPSHKHPYQITAGWFLLALTLPLLWWCSQPSWQLAVEPMWLIASARAMQLFTVVVAMLVFITGYRAILSTRKGAVILLGVAFLGVGLLDFLQLVNDTVRPDASGFNVAQKSLFFRLAARLLAAAALFGYVALPVISDFGKKCKWMALTLMLGAVWGMGFVGFAWLGDMPVLLFPDGHSVTPLGIGLEWLVVAINLPTLVVLWRRREELVHECITALFFSVALLVVSEIFLIELGIVHTDGTNVFAHFYKVMAYLYLFHATFNESLRRPLQRMEIQNLREKVVLSAAPDGILWVNKNGQIEMANPAMQSLSGYSVSELIGQNVDIFLPPHLRAEHAQSMRDYFISPHARAMGSMDLKLMRRDGQMLPIDISLGHWQDENEQHAIAYIRDLSERKVFEATLQHQATHDELTGLPNRWLFRLQLNQALAQAKRSEHRVAALFLDLDDFKAVNDSFGHNAGDELLIQVSKRLRGMLRENDTLVRLGGDEFAILLTEMESSDEAVIVAEKLLSSVNIPYRLQDQVVHIGGSIGIAFYPDDAQDSEDLLRYADMAMYQAKKSGRGTYACYSVRMDQQAHEHMQLHAHLKDAIDLGKLKLLYQPQVNVESGAIIGAEALLRWHDEILGDVSPARFIPIAETTGLILPLSDWVLETACEQIAAWEQAGTPLRVAINFSAQQFRRRNLTDMVSSALKRTGANAQLLEIEITESVAMVQPTQAREQLDALVSLGCSISLDDFGTGYSSLAALKELPVSKLKIDRSFIKDLPRDLNDVKISKSIIALAHSLDLTLIAEGVETSEQLQFLRDCGCEAYQGWLFAKALSAADLTALLQVAPCISAHENAQPA